jgi:hypothetical protein
MGKTRQRDGSLRWTDPTGRSWTSPSQHPPPEPAVRTLPGLRTLTAQEQADRDAWAELEADGCSREHGCVHDPSTPQPATGQDGCAHLDPDADRLELRADDPFDTPLDDTDVLGELIAHGDGWGLALDDPTRWS